MKKVLFFVLLIVTVVAVKCKQDPRNDACFDADVKAFMADSICVLSCEGVCACNGVTYCNECEAMKQGFVVHPGDTIPCSQK